MAPSVLLRLVVAVLVVATTATTTASGQRAHVSGDVAYTRLYYRRVLTILQQTLNEQGIDASAEYNKVQKVVTDYLEGGETNWKLIVGKVRPFVIKINETSPGYERAYTKAIQTAKWSHIQVNAFDPASSWDYIYDLIKTVANATDRYDLVEKVDRADDSLFTSVTEDDLATSSKNVNAFVGGVTRELPTFPKLAKEVTDARYKRLSAAVAQTAKDSWEIVGDDEASATTSGSGSAPGAGSKAAGSPVSTTKAPSPSTPTKASGAAATWTTTALMIATATLATTMAVL